MKYPLLFLLAVFVWLAVACSRKTSPSKTVPARKPSSIIRTPHDKETTKAPPAVAAADSAGATAPVPMASPMIVIDGTGNIITSKDKLPEDIAARADYRVIARAFTPNQRQNLIYRFKMVPPKVLYVPEQYILKSAKGKYVVYRKKFWYWQKADGLFYLDETYYR